MERPSEKGTAVGATSGLKTASAPRGFLLPSRASGSQASDSESDGEQRDEPPAGQFSHQSRHARRGRNHRHKKGGPGPSGSSQSAPPVPPPAALIEFPLQPPVIAAVGSVVPPLVAAQGDGSDVAAGVGGPQPAPCPDYGGVLVDIAGMAAPVVGEASGNDKAVVPARVLPAPYFPPLLPGEDEDAQRKRLTKYEVHHQQVHDMWENDVHIREFLAAVRLYSWSLKHYFPYKMYVAILIEAIVLGALRRDFYHPSWYFGLWVVLPFFCLLCPLRSCIFRVIRFCGVDAIDRRPDENSLQDLTHAGSYAWVYVNHEVLLISAGILFQMCGHKNATCSRKDFVMRVNALCARNSTVWQDPCFMFSGMNVALNTQGVAILFYDRASAISGRAGFHYAQ